MMREVYDRALRYGRRRVWLEAMDSQAQALRFYEKEGFTHLASYTLDAPLMHPHYRGMLRLVKTL